MARADREALKILPYIGKKQDTKVKGFQALKNRVGSKVINQTYFEHSKTFTKKKIRETEEPFLEDE